MSAESFCRAACLLVDVVLGLAWSIRKLSLPEKLSTLQSFLPVLRS